MNLEVNKHFQELIMDWDHKFYYSVGGYGSSKSYHIAIKLILKLLSEKRKALVVREVYTTLKDSCFSLLLEVLSRLEYDNLYTYTTSPLKITFINGSEIIFRGADKPEKLKSINGISLVWLEEGAELKYSAFKELLGRLRTPISTHILVTQNPVSKTNWSFRHFIRDEGLEEERLYRERIIKNNDIFYHHSTVTDNKFVSQDYIDQLDNIKKYDEDLYRIAREGRFGVVGTIAFKNVSIESTESVVERVNRIIMMDKFDGLDFGFSVSYNALVRIAVDRVNNFLYVYKEWVAKDMINSEVTSKVHSILSNKYHRLVADSSRPELIEELKRKGLRIYKSKKGAGSVANGIQKVRSFNKIIIAEDCHVCAKELGEITFKKGKDDEVIENELSFDSHVLDAIVYALEWYKPTSFKSGVISRQEETDV